jgi:tetratricopeptide (TPR) repeat protein
MVSAIERLAQLHARREDWRQTGLFLDRLNDLAPESAVAGDLRGKFAANLAGLSGGESSSSAGDSAVPTLDELEKVVDLEMASDDDSESGDILSFSNDNPVDEIGLGDSVIDSLPNPLEAEDEVVIGEQEQAYSGKSVIQEMRGDPAKPDLDEDFLSEHLTEAEVFLKYGLVEKAREQLQAILDRYPDHLSSLMKMKEVFVEEARKSEAARCSLRVAQLLREKGDSEKASEWEEQARDLDPSAGGDDSESKEPVKPVPKAAAAPSVSKSAGQSLADLSLDVEELSIGTELSSVSSLDGPLGLGTDLPEEELTIDLVDDTGSGEPDEGLITDRISQLEFSLQQGLHEEAEEIFRSLEVAAPTHPDLPRLRARIKEPRAASPAQPLPVAGGDLDMDVELAFGGAPEKEAFAASQSAGATSGGDDGFFDLAAELRAHAIDSTPEEAGEAPSGLTSGEEESIDEIFKAFRKKVDQQVEEEDYETRYNLGIAYKEMGLLDEAIGEFQYASRDPKLFMECCSILGICFREKGMSELAVKWYRKALEATGHPEEKTLGLRYDLAELHLERGEHSQSLSLFSEVYGINSNYRDVASRIRELKKRVG